MIVWHAFSWDAFATLATGVAAVSAATFVGLRQLTLLERQTEIAAQNSAEARKAADDERLIRKQSLNLDLLERRLVVLEDFRSLWTEWTRESRLGTVDIEKLRVLLQTATLLYPERIVEPMRTSLDGLSRQHQNREWSKIYQSEDTEKSRDYLQKSFKEEDAVKEILKNSLDILIQETRVSKEF